MFGHYRYNANSNNRTIGFSIDYNKNNTIDIYDDQNTETPNFNTIAYLLITLPIIAEKDSFFTMLDNSLSKSQKLQSSKILQGIQLNRYNELIDNFGFGLINISSNENTFFSFPSYYIHAVLQYIKDKHIDSFLKYCDLKWYCEY